MPKVAVETDLDYAILGIMQHEPSSAKFVIKRIEREIGFFWKEVTSGQIYPTIKKLEKDRLIELKGYKDKTYPPEKLYTVTSKGIRKLKNWLLEPIQPTNFTFVLFQEFLLKLYFSSLIPLEKTKANIDTLENWLKSIKKLFDGYEKNLERNLDTHEDHKYFLLVLRFGIAIYDSLEEWIYQAKKFLK